MNALTHFPVLIVIVPLMSASVLTAIRRPGVAWAGATAVSWTCFVMAVSLLFEVVDKGPIVYLLGDWAAPWGIEYRIDTVNALILVIVSAIASLVAVYGRESIEQEIAEERRYLYYAMFMLCLSGQLGIAVTGDAFNLFVFLEIASLSTYVLVSLGRDRRALTAAFRYLTLGTIGATFYVIGVGLAYMMTGTLNMADLAERLPAVADTTTVKAALAFLTVGIGLKLALFPLHFWLPNAYTFAPSAATAFLAATFTKVSVYVLLRTFFTVFGQVDVFKSFHIAEVLMVLALVAMFTMSVVAIYQTNLKRMLAFSSVAQIGYMVLGISFVSVLGLTGTVVHLFNHAVMKAALFMAMGCIVLRLHSADIREMAGIGRRMPLTMAAFVVAGLSLIGMPLTVGFISKWYLVLAALEQDLWIVALLVLLSSLLAVIYIWRVVEVAYFRPVPADAPPIKEAPPSMLIPMWAMSGAAVFFGVDATFTSRVARGAAALLLGVDP